MSKYHAIRTTINGITFDSKLEARRYDQLRLLEQSGAIHELELQPKFTVWQNGKDKIEYVGDFRYIEDGRVVIEDTKGIATPVFRIKQKLFRAAFPDLELRVMTKEMIYGRFG